MKLLTALSLCVPKKKHISNFRGKEQSLTYKNRLTVIGPCDQIRFQFVTKMQQRKLFDVSQFYETGFRLQQSR